MRVGLSSGRVRGPGFGVLGGLVVWSGFRAVRRLLMCADSAAWGGWSRRVYSGSLWGQGPASFLGRHDSPEGVATATQDMRQRPGHPVLETEVGVSRHRLLLRDGERQSRPIRPRPGCRTADLTLVAKEGERATSAERLRHVCQQRCQPEQTGQWALRTGHERARHRTVCTRDRITGQAPSGGPQTTPATSARPLGDC